MEKSQKPIVVAQLHALFQNSALVVIAHQAGLTVDEVNTLRGRMRDAGATFKVTKNTLAKLALKGTQFEDLTGHFEGVTTVAASKDPIAAAKAAVGFANDNKKYTIVAGSLNGKILKAAEITALATLPSLDELRAKIIGIVQAPAAKIARIAAAPAGQLARVLQAYADKPAS